MDHQNSFLAHEVVIIGGGVAGLSAALHLAELGLKSLVIEAGSYPAHKICGEFFSPESQTILKHFNIHPTIAISNFNLITPINQLNFQFPSPASSISRFIFDDLLVQKARQAKITVLEHELVEGLYQTPDRHHLIKLASGKWIKAEQLLIGAGRVTTLLTQKSKAIKPLFMGIKGHFAGTLPNENQVYFYTFPGAYLGLSMVDKNRINIACLAQQSLAKQYTSVNDFMHSLALYQHASLVKTIIHEGKKLLPEWLSCQVPAFGIKQTPILDNVYFIGDAAGTIPPACGDGLALALATGKMVTPYVLQHDAQGFKKAWEKRYGPILRNGRILHEIMLRSWACHLAVTCGNYVPSLVPWIFNKTRLLEPTR